MRGQGIAILLSGLFLISVLLFSPSVTEPIQQNDWGTVDGISEEQILALDGLPESVKVSGRTGNSTSTWAWAVKAGSSDEDYGNGIAVDSVGSAYVSGYFQGTAAFGITSLTSSGAKDIFVAKLSSSGSWLWAVKAGGSGEDGGEAIAYDSSGGVYVTGYFESDSATFGSTNLSKSCAIWWPCLRRQVEQQRYLMVESNKRRYLVGILYSTGTRNSRRFGWQRLCNWIFR